MENAFCLDPSCFVTLPRLNDTLSALEELTKNQTSQRVYIPSEIYDVVILEPEQKFQKLPKVVKGWLTFSPRHDIRGMGSSDKEKYVSIMRKILQRFEPVPIRDVAKNITKLGKESIHLDDLLEKLGEKARKIFEMMAVSSRFKAKIISFGQKTESFLREIKITVIKSSSKLKRQIKNNRGIRTSIAIMLFSMSLPEVQQFINVFQLDPFPFTLASTASLGAFGVLMIGDG